MKAADAGKVGFVVLALGAAAFMAYSALSKSDPTDEIMVGQLCYNKDCKAEFEITGAEQKRLAMERKTATCPKCGKWEVGTGHKCGNCGRINEPVGHGSAPLVCTHCKKNWVYATGPK